MAGKSKITDKLDALTFRELHNIIRNSQSPAEAAIQLAISKTSLERYLKRIPCKETPFTYTALRSIEPADLEKYFPGDCDAKLRSHQTPLEKRTFRKIHEAILKSTSLKAAAAQLGVHHNTLRSYIYQLPFINEPLTYDELQRTKEKDITTIYPGDYETIPTRIKIPLKQRTFKAIHQAILVSSGITAAANCLGVGIKTLKIYLGQLPFKGEPLTYDLYDLLKNTEEKDITTIYPGDYEAIPILNKIPLKQRTFKAIHQAIRASSDITDAASKLGVKLEAFKPYLSQLPFKGELLTYDLLKNTEEKGIATIYPGDYEAVPTLHKIPLKQRTFKAIHEAILASDSIADAAGKLSTYTYLLALYLSHLPHVDKPLTYGLLKGKTASEIGDIYPGAYEEVPALNRLVFRELALEKIHQAIKNSTNLTQVASNLGCYTTSLKQFLDKLLLTNPTLTFERLQSLTTAEFCEYVLHAEEHNASARRRAPASRALSNATLDADDNGLPQETLLTMLDIIEDDVYFLAGVVDPFEETIEESPYPKHDAVSSSFPTEVNHKNASLAQSNLMLNPQGLTIENIDPMVLEDHTDLPLDFINSFSEAIKESPCPEHDLANEGDALDEIVSCEEVNLDELTSWPADLIVADSTEVAFEESATEVQDSGPSAEIEESALQHKSATNSSSLQSLPTFFNLRGKRAAPEKTIEHGFKKVQQLKVSK
ncbi:hypothetical protein ACNVED_16285 (plasmid) [Legionella sp. D16C41]|uniref:hypothetical protein n=1 Tax=Legionella sp. D16C41 TaxID=3402688 RepID=UPI003AF8C5C4